MLILLFSLSYPRVLRSTAAHILSSLPRQESIPPLQSSLNRQLTNQKMAENPIRFGIMGCAKIARKLARAILLAPNSTLYAIASRSLEKAELFATENELPKTIKIYGSYQELLDDPSIDVVYMPLPSSLHLHWAVLAAQKKKHLLLEKPPALDVVELDKILEACESNGVQFMDGSMWLHHPRTAKMKELLSDPKQIGQLEFVSSSFFCFLLVMV